MPEEEWTPGHLQALAASVADEFGIDRDLFASLIESGSNWDWKAQSPAGAVGLGQITPIAARDLGLKFAPTHPVENLRASAAYLAKMLQKFAGNVRLAVAAYNAGPALVQRLGRVPYTPETQNYVNNVISGWAKREAEIKQEPARMPPPDSEARTRSWSDEELEKMFPQDRSEQPVPAAPADQTNYILGGQR